MFILGDHGRGQSNHYTLALAVALNQCGVLHFMRYSYQHF